MTEHKYTPGPWEPRKAPGQDWFVCAPNVHAGEYQGRPYPRAILDSDSDTNYPPEVMAADARLIATAPKLLEALEWLTNASCGVSRTGEPCSDDECQEAIKNGQELIAKATGE